MSPKKEEKKRPAPDAPPADVLPATKRPAPQPAGDGTSTLPKKPQVPAPGSSESKSTCRGVMKSVIPWVLTNLPQKLAEHKLIGKANPLRSMAPLELPPPAGAKGKELSSYKPAWNSKACHASVTASGLYEAGANVTWIDPEITGWSLPGDEPSWSWLEEAAVDSFRIVDFKGNARILFPIPLTCYWRHDVAKLQAESLPDNGGLTCLSGHAFLYAWYVACFKALVDEDMERCRALYQCGLTATVTLVVHDDLKSLALESIRASEKVNSQAQVMVDSFLTFAEKVHIFAEGKYDLKALSAVDLRFKGSKLNGTMLKTLLSLRPLLTDEAKQWLVVLEREAGREVLTGSYSKLRYLAMGVRGNAEHFSWVIESMVVGLRREEMSAEKFTLEAFTRKKDDDPVFFQYAIMHSLMIKRLAALSSNIGVVDQSLATKLQSEVVDKLKSPSMWNERFPAKASQDGGVDGVSDVEVVAGSSVSQSTPALASTNEDFMALCEKTLPRGGLLFAELFDKVYKGEFWEDAKQLLKEPNPEQTLQDLDEDKLKRFSAEVKAVMKALQASENVVSATGGAAPKPTFRELVRGVSDGGDPESAQQERDEIWKKCVQYRKKYVNFAKVGNTKSQTSYVEVSLGMYLCCPCKFESQTFRNCMGSRVYFHAVQALKKFASVQNFVGKPGSKHRVWVLSADLLMSSGKKPWLEPSLPDEKVMDEAVAFLKSRRGLVDVLMVFDGCQRKTRQRLYAAFDDVPHTAEVMMVYQTSWNAWIKKKYFLSSENCECGYISMPITRNKMFVTERPAQSNANKNGQQGPSSSHFTSFTNVEVSSRLGLARISDEDRLKIFPEETEELPRKWVQAVNTGRPLFWQETKSLRTWETLLQEVAAECVIDLSPGSGVLAEACMSLGKSYVGLVAHATHLCWLQNVADRIALRYISKHGSFLFCEPTAKMIQMLFADAVEDSAADDEAIQLSDDEGN